LREFLTLTYTRSADYLALAAAFFVVLPLQYALVYVGMVWPVRHLRPVYVFLLLPILEGPRRRHQAIPRAHVEDPVGPAWFACIASSHVPALLTLDIPGYEGRNLLLIAFLVIVVQSSDVLQYVWGKLFGKHKIAPEVSPSKTVEGLVGGLLSATALGAALWWITPFNWWQAALMSLAIT
jgi:phosphatidate cytidylyltransferase